MEETVSQQPTEVPPMPVVETEQNTPTDMASVTVTTTNTMITTTTTESDEQVTSFTGNNDIGTTKRSREEEGEVEQQEEAEYSSEELHKSQSTDEEPRMKRLRAEPNNTMNEPNDDVNEQPLEVGGDQKSSTIPDSAVSIDDKDTTQSSSEGVTSLEPPQPSTPPSSVTVIETPATISTQQLLPDNDTSGDVNDTSDVAGQEEEEEEDKDETAKEVTQAYSPVVTRSRKKEKIPATTTSSTEVTEGSSIDVPEILNVATTTNGGTVTEETPSSSLSTTKKNNDTENIIAVESSKSSPERWRVHQMAEDYVHLVGNMMYPATKFRPYGYHPDKHQYPLDGISVLGFIKSKFRRPTIVEKWSPYEIAVFEGSLLHYGKEFREVSRQIGTKSTQEVIDFYYVWKKTAHYKRWKEQFISDANLMMELESPVKKPKR